MDEKARSAASTAEGSFYSDAATDSTASSESRIPQRQSESDDARHREACGVGEQDSEGETVREDSPGQRGHAKGTGKLTARAVLNRIGENFVRTVDKNRGKAYAKLRSELMENIGVLVPDACSIEQILGKVIDIENFVKGDTSEMVESPQEALAKWLKEDGDTIQ